MIQERMNRNHNFRGPLVGSDEQTFSEVFLANRNQVFVLVTQYYACPHRAEDITQEIFLQAWLHWSRIRHMEKITGYILQITRNTCLNHLKTDQRVAKRRNNYTHHLCDAVCDTDQPLYAKELETLLGNAVEKLSPCKKVVYTMLNEGFHYREVATKLHVSHRTILAQRAEAYKFIRTHVNNVMNIGLNKEELEMRRA